MGVVTSLPAPVIIQLQDIQSAKIEFILDSAQYEQNPLYFRKAINKVIKNKSIQKVILKLSFPSLPENIDFTKELTKLLNSKGTLVIYGNNLHFFNRPKWIKIWASAKLNNLQIKFEMNDSAFDCLAEGLSANKSVKILAFRFMSDSQLIRLSECLSANSSIYNLQVILESRVYTLDNMEEGIQSSKMPSTPQSTLPISFLSQSQTVSTFTLGGYHNRANFVSGIIRNKSIKTLVLDNIDIEKFIRHDWNVAFKENSYIQEVKALRGLNTLSSMILFQSLRKNHTISSLYLEECVFFSHGFIGLENLLRQTTALKRLNLKNLLHLNLSKYSQVQSVQNLAKVLSAIGENTTLLDVIISNSVSNDSIKLEDTERILNGAFEHCLKNNKTVKNLVIENFKLGPESFPGIAEGLKKNSSLQNLCVKGNSLLWPELALLVNSLRLNSNLLNLDVSSNCLIRDFEPKFEIYFSEIILGFCECKLRQINIDANFWNLKVYPDNFSKELFQCAQRFPQYHN